MPQLHFYVPAQVADEVRRRALARGLSVSGYVSELVRHEIGGGWPEGYFSEVVGGWAGGSLERPPQPALEERDEL